PLPDPAVAVHPSGLRVVVRPMPDAPVASAHLWFDTGAADETDENAGAAHFLEHLVFKGTARRGVGEAAAAIEAAGGDLNAWTSWDETCFHATLEAGELALALDVVFDMASNAVLDPVELDRERQVVLEEIRGYDDDPDAVVADRMQTLLFGRHPYGRPVIGFPRTVELAQVLEQIEPLVRGWAIGRPRSPVAPCAVAASPTVERLDRDFGSVVVHFAWPAPPIGHPDLPALDVLMAALGQGAASRLTVLLDLQGGYASQVYADGQSWIGGGLLAAGFLCGETEAAVELAVREFARVHREGLPSALVTRARDAILADQLFANETTDGVAGDLAWNVARMNDPLADRRYAEAIATVTTARVAEVARAWLSPERMQLVVLDKGLTARKLKAITKGALAPPRGAPRRTDGGVWSAEVHGVKLVGLVERSPIAAVTVIGTGGQLQLDDAHAGLAEGWSRAVLRGAGPYDATAFGERTDALALQIDAIGGRSVFHLDASFPVSFTDESIDTLGQVLLDPQFHPDDCRTVREEMLDDRAALVDRPTTVASERLWAQLWPGHPWRLPALGSGRTVGRIGGKSLRAHHQAQLAADNLVIGLAGGLDPDRVATALEPFLRDLPRRSAVPKRPEPGPRGGDVEATAGNEQAVVLVGVRGVRLDDPDRAALTIASHLLDSQSGRMFLELREQRGLAYGVWARSETGIDGGVFSAGLATDPQRVDEAMRELLRVLTELAEQGPTEAEVKKVARMVHGLSAMRLQRVAGRAHDLGWATRFGLPYGLPALAERLQRVTPADVARVLRQIGITDPVRVVVRPTTERGG
ncbi:MAG: pitrilysin family protein, partial [Myxococcota bacterium]